MKILNPVPSVLTSGNIVSTTVPEPDSGDPAAWNATRVPDYAIGELVSYATTHKIYKCIKTSYNNVPTNTTYWQEYAPMGRYAPFDQTTSTQASCNSPLTYVLETGQSVGAIALLDVVGQSAYIKVVSNPHVTPVTRYEKTITLSTAVITDWYMYFFSAFTQKKNLIVFDLPPYPDAHIEITITSGSNPVKVGGIILGDVEILGGTHYGAQAGIRDYSRKVVDEATGMVTLEQRKYAKTMSVKFHLDNGSVNSVHDRLANLRATPIVWIGDDDAAYEPLIIFGFYKDFRLEISHPSSSYYTLEIEGMT